MEVLSDAFNHECQICISWLDLGNIFELKHNILQNSMAHHNFPHILRSLIFNYYSFFTFKILTSEWETFVIKCETGIFPGYLSSVGLKIVFSYLLDLIRGIADGPAFLCRTRNKCKVQSAAKVCWGQMLHVLTINCDSIKVIDSSVSDKFLGTNFQFFSQPDPNYATDKGLRLNIKTIDSPVSGTHKS